MLLAHDRRDVGGGDVGGGVARGLAASNFSGRRSGLGDDGSSLVLCRDVDEHMMNEREARGKERQAPVSFFRDSLVACVIACSLPALIAASF